MAHGRGRPVQLCVEIRVRIPSGMRDRHPLATRLDGFSRRRQAVPFADGEADNLETSLHLLRLRPVDGFQPFFERGFGERDRIDQSLDHVVNRVAAEFGFSTADDTVS